MAFGNSILQFSQLLSGDEEAIIDFLQSKHLLSSAKNCPACGASMEKQRRSDVSDGYR